MSRIGKRELEIPTGVTVTVNENVVTVKGALGELNFTLTDGITVNVNENKVTVESNGKNKLVEAMHGTTNALIKNMIKGVSEGYAKGVEIYGVGYKFQVNGKELVVNAGYSHPVKLSIPEGLTVESVSNTEITVKGINKELVGEFAAKIRKVRKPEPYKGKGIRYKDEFIRRKEGKKASK